MAHLYDYNELLNKKAGKLWQRLGTNRRAGVLAPLFSVYSKDSAGIGEIPDIKLLSDWCVKCGMSIIQLLPMNDTGYTYTPYDSQSTFALDPMYLRLESLAGVDILDFEKMIGKLKQKFPAGNKRVDYGVKGEKLKILWQVFESLKRMPKGFREFCDTNKCWLDDYAAYKILKEFNNESSWEAWEEKYKYREGDAAALLIKKEDERFDFHRWVQFQLCLQMKDAREYANKKGVFIQGDLPFLVARDSADTWSHQRYFNMNINSGAPPDMYFALGQRWGMPTYNWERIEEHGYDYIKERVRYAGNFYDMMRIDHFVGLFRIWSINNDEPADTYGLNGKFDPADESKWKGHGQKILDAMLEGADMLPCAEDLGVVPACSYETLEEYGFPGMDVQRWSRDWGKTYEFKAPERYRLNSIAVISSHDMAPLRLWWETEAGRADSVLVEKFCADHDYNAEEVKRLLFEPGQKGPRLKWKDEIDSPEKVLLALGKSRDDAWMFYDMNAETRKEREYFVKMLGIKQEEKAGKEFIAAAIKKSAEARSVFSINLIQDLLCLGDYFDGWDLKELRANTPGTVNNENWTIVMPVSLEGLLGAEINTKIQAINKGSGRI